MAGRRKAIQPAVDHVGYPSQRVPVAGMECGERPAETFRGYPILDIRILRDVFFVVEIDKVMGSERPVDDESYRQEKRDEDVVKR